MQCVVHLVHWCNTELQMIYLPVFFASEGLSINSFVYHLCAYFHVILHHTSLNSSSLNSVILVHILVNVFWRPIIILTNSYVNTQFYVCFLSEKFIDFFTALCRKISFLIDDF